MFDEYAQVVFNLPAEGSFTYIIPADLRGKITAGSFVKARIHGREEEGIVVSLSSAVPSYKCSEIEELLCEIPLVSESQMRLAEWISDYYFCTYGEALFRMFVRGRKIPRAHAEKKHGFPALSELSESQKAVCSSIAADLDEVMENQSDRVSVHLLRGVTGSGKTEIYIHLLKKCIEAGRGAVLLVPEIALTVQLFERLRRVFGEELALLHSALRNTERFASYVHLLRKEKLLAVGTRSAVFAPVENPALFIIDEEHDSSYKENSTPRYDARQIALRRASETGAVVLFGSATPRIETEFMARTASTRKDSRWKFSLHILKERARGAKLPEVRIVQRGPSDIPVGPELIAEIHKNIELKEQTILLLNRRGYAHQLQCRNCGTSAKCPHCSVSLTYHRSDVLICHYCGYMRSAYESCTECGGRMMREGSGTQKVEEYVAALFPDICIERMDSDIKRTGSAVHDILTDLENGRIDVLTGSQMIARGIDAQGVTLVGALQADSMLNIPDFRSFERTFSLLTQVAGRAGRGRKPGRVIFEAANPDHPVIRMAAAQDYEAFYNDEIKQRKEFNYPPFSRLFRLLVRSYDPERSEDIAMKTAAIISSMEEFRDTGTQILGPAAAPLEKLNDQYRFHIIIKTSRPDSVRKGIHKALPLIRGLLRNTDYLEIDPDPADLM